MFKQWQAITLWKRVLIGLVVGMAIGLALRYSLGPSIQTVTSQIVVSPSGDEQLAEEAIQTPTNTPIEISLFAQGSFHYTSTITEITASNGSADISQATTISYTPPADWNGTVELDYTVTTPYGRAAAFANSWIKPFGDAFVRLIKMLIIPLIGTTLVAGVTAMGDPKKLGSLGARTISLYLLTTFFAVNIGLIMGTIVRPGAGVKYEQAGEAALASVEDKIEQAAGAGSLVDRMLEIIPTNPIEAWADGAVLPTIFFSILIGIGILVAGSGGDPIRHFFDSASEVVLKITILVMELAPYGVLALMAWVMAVQGIEVLVNMGMLAFALYFACALQIVFVYGWLIIKMILGLPMKQFFRGIADAQGVAFSTASSNATLPVSISCAETNLGVKKSVAGSVLPLGATINMDGTAIYLGLVALFAAQAGGISLSFTQYAMVALTATLVSVGAAGIPSAGLLLAATVLEVIGVGEAQALLVIAFIFPFDRLLDMMRTMTNISGDIAVSCTVAKWEGALDEEVFRTEARV